MKKLISSYWKTIMWTCIVLILSLMPKKELSQMPRFDIPHLDKLVHFTMYFVFTFFMLWDTKRYYSKTRFVLGILIFTILFGATMEFLQNLPTIHRSRDFFDFLANSIGAVMAVLIFLNLEKKIKFLTIN